VGVDVCAAACDMGGVLGGCGRGCRLCGCGGGGGVGGVWGLTFFRLLVTWGVCWEGVGVVVGWVGLVWCGC